MADENQELIPDQKILLGIFPEIPSIPEDSYPIICNTFDSCTFRLSLATQPRPDFPSDLIVRLGRAGSHLAAVAELQRLAHTQIPEFVPATLEVGTVFDEAGNKLDYSIFPFITETAVLEDVWNGLTGTNQLDLMDSVAGAMERLQKLPVTEATIRQVLRHDADRDSASNSSDSLLVGGPDAGYHGSIKALLAGLVSSKATELGLCEVVSTADGIAVHTAHGPDSSSNRFELNASDLENLLASIVFCHNDLEPRNILVKKASGDKTDRYELAAIIDWEMAGYFPFTYEYGLKDTLLGTSNLEFSWYSLFKERTAAFLPTGAGQAKLIKALAAIGDANSQAKPTNVGVRFQGK